jgi:hypothetical protein
MAGPRRRKAQSSQEVVSLEQVEMGILEMRAQRVILDADLAAVYGVGTKRLNEQVKRNMRRFPLDFAFRLTSEEKAEVVAKCDHLQRLKFSATRPLAFTEHGAIMAANVLNSERAVEASVLVVRAFVRLRQLALTHADLSRRLYDLERKYDARFRAVFDAIRALMAQPRRSLRRIGFPTNTSRA